MNRVSRASARALVVSTLIACGSSSESDPTVSNFDRGSEGWTVIDSTSSNNGAARYGTVLGKLAPLAWSATDGAQGGFVSHTDTTNNAFFFEAPSAYLGDLSSYVGGTLRFSLRSSGADWQGDDVVVIVGGNGRVLVAPLMLPSSVWSTYSLPLDTVHFRDGTPGGAAVTSDDLEATLADVRALRIPGEWGQAVRERVDLDSVALTPP